MCAADKKKIVVAVVGPTAVGKTTLAIRLAKHLNAEIVSADSRQFYKEMNIGTAKPSLEELKEINHHFIGCQSIKNRYSAGEYAREALMLMTHLFATGKSVVLCGGSGMYIKALCEGFDEVPPVSPKISAQVMEGYKKKGLKWLQEQVSENDPNFFATVDQQNPRRLIRALELNLTTNKPIGMLWGKKKQQLPFTVIKIGLELDRKVLYSRIEDRVDSMMRQGLLEEARALFPYRLVYTALQTIGYRELFGYFEGFYSLEEAILLFKKNTRRYAKRQFTWFRKNKDIRWFHPDSQSDICIHIDQQKKHLTSSS